MPANPRAASVRLKASKGSTLVTILHDFRQGAQPAYIEAARSGANSILQPAPPLERIYALAEQRYAAASRRREAATGKPLRKRRTDASPATTLILTFGADVQETLAAMSADDQDAALGAALDRVAAYLDAPVLWAAVHRDEAALHLHAGLCAVRGDGQAITTALQAHPDPRPAAAPADWTSRPNTSDLQTELHAALVPHIAGIERGHRKVDRLKAGEPLAATKTQTHQMLKARLGLGPEAESTEVTAAVTKLRTATAQATDREREIAEKENQLEAVKAQIADQHGVLEAWHEKIDTLQPRLDRLTTKQAETGLTPREEKRLGIYTRRLEGYRTAQAEIQDTLDDLESEAKRLARETEEAATLLEQTQKSVTTATAAVTALDNDKTALTRTVTDLTDQRDQLTKKIKAQTDTLAKLDNQFAGQQAALQDKLTDAEAHLKTITQEITAGQDTLAELDRQAAAAQRDAVRELDATHAAVATAEAARDAATAARATIETLEPAGLLGPSKDQEYREAAIRAASQLAEEREQAHQGLLTRLATTIEEVATRAVRPHPDTPGAYENLLDGAMPPLLTADDLDQTPRPLWARICDLWTAAAFNFTLLAISERKVEVNPTAEPGFYVDLDQTGGEKSPWWQANAQSLLSVTATPPLWDRVKAFSAAIHDKMTLLYKQEADARVTAAEQEKNAYGRRALEAEETARRVDGLEAQVKNLKDDLNNKKEQEVTNRITHVVVAPLEEKVKTLEGQLATERDTNDKLTKELQPHRAREAAERRAQQDREDPSSGPPPF